MGSKSPLTEYAQIQSMGGVVGAVKAALRHVLLHCGEKRIRWAYRAVDRALLGFGYSPKVSREGAFSQTGTTL